MELEDINLEEFEKHKVDYAYLPKSAKCLVCDSLISEGDTVLLKRSKDGDIRKAKVIGHRCRKTHEAKEKNANLGQFA